MTFQRRSNRRSITALGWLWLLIWMLVPAMAEPMVVVLKNGDRLSGEITSENDRRVILKSAVAGRITIPRAHIERILTAAEFADSLKAASAPPAAPTPTPAPAAAPAPTPTPPVAAATTKPATSPAPAPAAAATSAATNAPPVSGPWLPNWFTGVWTNWHGNAQLGANMGFGATDRYALFATAAASKKWGRTTSFVNYSLSYGVVNGTENANRMAGDTKVDVDFSKNRKFYTYGLGGAGYDVIREINLEYHVGAGLGYKFLDRPNLVLAGELGGQYQAYDYYNAPDKDNIAARLGENLTTKLGEKVTLTQRFGFTPGIEDPSDYQIRFGFTVSAPLFKPLTLNFNLANEYDSQPAPGVSNNDLQISTTIGINF